MCRREGCEHRRGLLFYKFIIIKKVIKPLHDSNKQDLHEQASFNLQQHSICTFGRMVICKRRGRSEREVAIMTEGREDGSG